MCCTSLRNLLCNLELRSIEARMGKLLKGQRHYNLKLGNFQDKFYARNDQPGRIKCSKITRQNQEGINRIRIFFNIPKGSMYQQGGRNKVKIKDLKPKRIKDYLECKINQRNLNQPRKSAQAGPVVSGRDIPFVIQLKQIIEAPR
ncbi:hypothetical protein GQ457_14G017310 [Hibiscus cannabinus]